MDLSFIRNRWNTTTAATAIALAVLLVLALGYWKGAIWGAVATASISSIFSCITLAQAWRRDEETNRPRVIFYVHREGDDILLNLTNVGVRPAFDVRVKLDRPLWFLIGEVGWEDHDFEDLRKMVGFLYEPVEMLAPGQTLSSLNRLRRDDDEELTETVLAKFNHEDPKYNNEGITGIITYTDERGRQFSEKTKIGFAALKNMKLETVLKRHTYNL